MQEKIYALIGEILGLAKSQITEDTEMKSVESWDSLRHMELISSIESLLEIELSIDEIVKMNSVSGIFTVLKERNIN